MERTRVAGVQAVRTRAARLPGLVLAAILAACGGGGGGGDGQGTVIGSAGGTAAGAGGIAGASVTVPPGAIPPGETRTITLTAGVLVDLVGHAPLGPAVAIGPEGATFAQPVTVTIPFDASQLPAGTSIADIVVVKRSGDASTGFTIEILPPVGVDSVNGRVSALTTAFSTFQAQARLPLDAFSLALDPLDATRVEGETVALTVTRTGSVARDLVLDVVVVNLGPGVGATLAGPKTFTLFAGQTAGGFVLTAVDDTRRDNGRSATVQVRTRDGSNLLAAEAATITVTDNDPNVAPTVDDLTPTTSEDTPLASNLVGNDFNLDVIAFAIDDGATLGTVVLDDVLTGAFTYTPPQDFNGTDTFTYTAADDELTSAPATVTITVTPVNDAPVANPDAVSTDEDTALVLPAATLIGNDTDVDGDTLTIVGVGLVASGQSDATLRGGTVQLTNGSVTYTPPQDFFGLGVDGDTFQYHVTDGQVDDNGDPVLATATVTVSVNGISDPPTAVTDAFTVNEDSGANTLDVRANDSFAPDVGETLTVSAVGTATKGTVAIAGGGTGVTYTPNANAFGPDSFTYTIADDGGLTSTTTVSITITEVNDDPVANADAATVAEDTTTFTPIDVLANDSDGVDAGAEPADVLTVTAVTQPANGQAQIASAGAEVSYRPNANFFGSDTFTYTVSDGRGGSASAQVTVTVTNVNDAPTASDDTLTLAEDAAATAVDVLANDVVGPANEDATDTKVITAVTQGAKGTVQFTSSTLTYEPQDDANGADSFTYTMSDSQGGSDTATVLVTITEVNDPPTAVADSANVLEDAATTTIAVLGNDSIAPDAGETLRVTVVTQPANGVATILPDGSAVTYRPNGNFFGTDTFQYTVTDRFGDAATLTSTATVTVTVTGVNDPPTADPESVIVAEDSGFTTIDVLDGDTPGPNEVGALTVTAIASAPANGTAEVLAGGSGVRYRPNTNFPGALDQGSDSFTYTVRDPEGLTATGNVSITVTQVNDTPVAVAQATATTENTAIDALTLQATDVEDALGALTFNLGAASTTLGGTVEFGVHAAGGPVVTYTPPAGVASGLDTFTFTVTDSDGATSTAATVEITISDAEPPIVVADLASTDEEVPVEIDVLANDQDDPGNIGGGLVTSTLAIASGPSNGQATVSTTTGIITYTPDPDFFGDDVFTYTIRNNANVISTATSVTVTVINVDDDPVAVDDDVDVGEDSGANVLNVRANDSDADGDTLTITQVTQGAKGSVSTDGATVTYTPNANQNGADSFTYTLSDGAGPTSVATVSVTITAVNDAPVAVDDAFDVTEDTPTILAVRANDTDVDGDTLTITAVTQGASGTVTNNGTTVTYSPNLNSNAADSFTYTISDGNGGTDTASVSITILAQNDTPTTIGIPNVTTDEDINPSSINLATRFSDVETAAASLTYTLQTGFDTNLFDDVSITGTTLAIDVKANAFGSQQLTVRASDGQAFVEATFTVTVNSVNDAPTTNGIADVDVDEDASNTVITLADKFSDVETASSALTYSIVGTPSAALFDSVSVNNTSDALTIDYKLNANGSTSLTVRATDAGGLTVDATFSVTIDPVNDAPTVINPLPDVNVLEDAVNTVINLVSGTQVFSDVETTNAASLTYSVSSGNTGLVTVSVNNSTDQITLDYVADANGSTNITVTASDGTLTVDDVFAVNVTAVNDAPTLNDPANVSAISGTSRSVSLSGIDEGESNEQSQTLSVTAVSSNTTVLPHPTVNYTPDSTTGSLTLNPAAGRTTKTTVTVTVTVTDSGGTANGGDNSTSQAFTVTVGPDSPYPAPIFRDTTLFEEGTSLSSGAGQTLYAGECNRLANSAAGGNAALTRRALIRFSLSELPSDATITDANVELRLLRGVGGNRTFNLHRVTQDWGEAGSNSAAGQGASALTNDATWSHRFFSSNTWTNAGGTFDGTASDGATVGDAEATITWSSATMTSDVQGWFASPATNFGWLLKASSEVRVDLVGGDGVVDTGTAKEFASSEFTADTSERPRLVITYTVP